jgi:hypothetical protein
MMKPLVGGSIRRIAGDPGASSGLSATAKAQVQGDQEATPVTVRWVGLRASGGSHGAVGLTDKRISMEPRVDKE